MSTFKEIQGRNIRSYTTNPDNPLEGQMWYNQTELKLKGVTASGAWSSTSPGITARSDLAGFGIQTAAVGAGGYITAAVANVEEYNGSGWSNATAIPTATNSLAGFGVLTAGVVCGGVSGSPTRPNATFEYNGTSWTGGGNLNTGRQNLTGVGIETAGLVFGSSNPNSNICEEYNGSAWTAVNAMNRPSINNQAAGGVQTAAYGAGGYIPGSGNSNGTENYDGTNWTTSGNIPAARRSGRGSGTQTDGIMAGGNGPGITTAVLNYNGTTWSVNPASLGTAREGTAPSQNAPASTTLISFGYDGSGRSSLSEEYNFTANTITAGAWAAGGSMNTARRSMFVGPMGTQTAGLAAGGYTTTRVANTEEYNGSSWTSGNNTTDTLSNRGAAGTQTAGLLFGGNPSPAVVTDTEEYDGTNWTAGGALNNARGYGVSGAGTQTAALAAGGYNPSGATFVTVTEYYNGTAWTAQPNANPNNYAGASGGTQAAAWLVGASAVSPGPANTEAYNWNGTSWTASGNYGTSSVVNMFGGGTQTAGWMCGGDADPGLKTFTNHYDGTNWSTAPALGTARSIGGQSGTQSSGLIFGGYTGSNTTATEEFTSATTATNVVDITTS